MTSINLISIVTPNFPTFLRKRERHFKILVSAKIQLSKRPTMAALWSFGGPTFTKKKLYGNFLTPLFMLKSIKISSSANQQIVKSTINDLIVKQELPATATNLIITTPRTSCIYSLPKIHKPNNPGRPIVSACNCPTELISSYLDLLSDLYRHTLKTVNTHFKFFAISISWAKTSLFSLCILHLFTPSSQMTKVF